MIIPRILVLIAALAAFCSAKSLKVWIMPNGANPEGVMREQLEKFKQLTGNDYNLEILDWGEAWGRIHNALELNRGPDILQLGSTWLPYFAHQGWLHKIELSLKDLDRFYPQTLQSGTFHGSNENFGMPWFLDLRVMFANRGLLNQYKVNFDSLKTWKEFRTALIDIKLEGKSKEHPADAFGFPGKSDWNIPHNFAPWVWSEGGAFLSKNEQGWKSDLLKPETARAIRRYIGLVIDSLASRATLSMNTASVTQRFNNGEQAFIIGTSEILQQSRILGNEGGLKNSAIGQMGILTHPIPEGEAGSVAFLGGSHLTIPKSSKNYKEALELLRFLTTAEQLNFYSKRIGFLPPDRNVLHEWGDDPLYEPLIKSLPAARSYPNLAEWGSVEGTLVEMFSAIWSVVDVPGFYSDRELYEILVRYDGVINQQLGYEGEVSIPKFQDFIKFLDPIQPGIEKALASKGSKSYEVLVIGGVLFILGLFVVWRRSKHK